MQREGEKWVLNKTEIDCSNRSDSANHNVTVSGPSVNPITMVNSERFYQRLGEFFESSGLSLVLNARDTVVDLYLIYKEVTQRGGFHQVTRHKRWDEVASAVKLEGSNSKFETQLQKLYATLLIQFEHIYSYRSPEKPARSPDRDSSGTKRKYQDTINFMSNDIDDGSTRKGKCIEDSLSISKGSWSVKQTCEVKVMSNKPEVKVVNIKPDAGSGSVKQTCEVKVMNSKPEVKVVKTKSYAPQGWRNPYQLFLKAECARLKSIHGPTLNGKNVRDVAIDTWKFLPNQDRQPYVELSRKDKERFWQEMKVYTERKNSESSVFKGDYHVSPQPDAEKTCPVNQSMVDLATEMMKTPPSDESLSDVNWYEFYG